MNKEIINAAVELKNMGYSIVPVDGQKISTVKIWHVNNITPGDFGDYDCKGIAVLTGNMSDHFCAIDIDRKDVIDKIPKELLINFVVQQTPRGHHILFKANLSKDEDDRYQEFLAEDKSIEIRQGRSYYIVHPTPGYIFLDGKSMKHVKHVTFEEFTKLKTFIKVNCI